jgi:putative phosphoesterase
MTIGIISDTHDNVINIQKAVDIFKKNNVEFVIHAGDIVAPASVKFFEGVMMKFIFGNCDGDRALIEEKVREHDGWEHHGSAMELKYKGKMIGVVHGDNLLMNDKMMHKGYDYFIHGHTHTPEDKRVNKTRVLCPGGHYLGDSKDTNKVILLDVEKDKAVFVDVK